MLDSQGDKDSIPLLFVLVYYEAYMVGKTELDSQFSGERKSSLNTPTHKRLPTSEWKVPGVNVPTEITDQVTLRQQDQ